MAVEAPARPAPVGARLGLVLAVLAAAAWAFWQLELDLATILPEGRRLQISIDFFRAAVTPALSPTTLGSAGQAIWTTLEFATAAMALALVIGIVLGFFASSAWWTEPELADTGTCLSCLRCTVCPVLFGATRVFIAVLRSIHELFWALILLMVLGIEPFAGVLAIAIPYGCTLAKVFAEMVDETPRAPARALRATGASALQVYFFGLVPQAMTDMVAYSFYRFECTIRSAAILGFFGYETLGYFLKQSFGEADYAATWTHLYALLLLVVAADWWSGAFRRSFAR